MSGRSRLAEHGFLWMVLAAALEATVNRQATRAAGAAFAIGTPIEVPSLPCPGPRWPRRGRLADGHGHPLPDGCAGHTAIGAAAELPKASLVGQVKPPVAVSHAPQALPDSALGTVSALPVITYFWDFGDGTTGSGQSPTHTYHRPGRYTVTLVMFSGVGSAFPGAGAGPISTQSLTVTG